MLAWTIYISFLGMPKLAVIAPVTPLQQNCTIVWCAKTLKAAIIDPGGEVAVARAAAYRGPQSERPVMLTGGSG